MRVLVVGSGGREHALCWALARSPEVDDLFCAPGNPGIAAIADRVPVAVDEIGKLADFAHDLKVDLTVVGPELPLVLGIANEFASRGLPIFGASREAAELEGSKVFAKGFMDRHGIPTARFEVAHNAEEAGRSAKRFGFPVVLKADGLAAGKGVLIPRDREELEAALAAFFKDRRFGASGDRIVVEEFLEGEEVSLMALVDGEHVLPLATSKDYKRLEDDDQGLNTGGMGAHSPAGVLGSGVASRALETILRPTLRGLEAENRPLVGVLYAGLILTEDGPRVLEYNVRLGDPEAQAVLLRVEDDLVPVLAGAAAGAFPSQRLAFRKEASACLVLASEGYPEKPVLGSPITLTEAASGPGIEIFHAGTGANEAGDLVVAGGRVINVCATGATLREALRRAYAAAEGVTWPGRVVRRDIGRRVLARMASEKP